MKTGNRSLVDAIKEKAASLGVTHRELIDNLTSMVKADLRMIRPKGSHEFGEAVKEVTQVKPFVRTRSGRLERVGGYTRKYSPMVWEQKAGIYDYEDIEPFEAAEMSPTQANKFIQKIKSRGGTFEDAVAELEGVKIRKLKKYKKQYDRYRTGKFAPAYEIQVKKKIRDLLAKLDWSRLSRRETDEMERIESAL